MVITRSAPYFTRSFPKAREFLQTEIVGSNYPVKHLIEQARSKGHITKGKRGRGGGVVTSRDMAVLLTAILAGDTPQDASDALTTLTAAMPHSFFDGDDDTLEGLKDGWWDGPLSQVISGLIDASRNHLTLNIDELIFTVYRAPIMQAQVDWQFVSPPVSSEGPFETRHVTYTNEDQVEIENVVGRQTICASFDGRTLMRVADWLEGREGHS
jgi:hypothetical protein